MPFLQVQIMMDKTNRLRKDLFWTIPNTLLPYPEANPLLALFEGWNDRLRRDEELLAESFFLGGLLNGVGRPLSAEFADYCDRKIATIIFGKEHEFVVKSHSSRKCDVTSAHNVGLSGTDVRLLGRWGLGILDFYAQTTPSKFVLIHKEIAKWAIRAFHQDKYVPPVVRDHSSALVCFF